MRALLSMLTLCLTVFPAHAKYSGGSGTAQDPYRISTVADLVSAATTSADWKACFLLTADLDLADYYAQGGAQFKIGQPGPSWTGTFDGGGHTISGFKYVAAGAYYSGLFAYPSGGKIQNLGLINVHVGAGSYSGGLVGYNDGSTVSNCWSVGGTVKCDSYVGGLVGYNDGGAISNCFVTGTVEGKSAVGGFTGANDEGTIANCHASGTVIGESSVGGLVGRHYLLATISDGYWRGPVTGKSQVGGLVGYASGTILRCYAAGAVTGESSVGGLVGYSLGGSVLRSFWDVEASGQAGSSGGKGLTTSQMRSATIYANAGWSGAPWVIRDGQDYPRLNWENEGGAPIPEPAPVSLAGRGTADDPWQVWTTQEFALLSWCGELLDGHLRLMADLDLSGVALWPIGDIAPFAGVFDGGGHILRNAVVNIPTGDYAGLFGNVDPNGEVRNLGAENLAVTGRRCVGGLVAWNGGRIAACYTEGTVSGDAAGGLVGDNSGRLEACHAAGLVSGSSAGGLVGTNRGRLTVCYATSLVTSPVVGAYVGGLVRWNDRGSTYSSFWDIQASGQAGSSTGKGLTTAQMKSRSIYQNAGWAGTPWVIRDNEDYPRLAWENKGGDPIPEPEPMPLAGGGTAEDPWQVWTAEDFAVLSWHSAALGGHLRLMADLDLSGVALCPLGDLGPFDGVFDGDGHTLRNVVIDQPANDYVGLVCSVGTTGRIEHLGLDDVTVNGRDCVGGMAGYSGRGTIADCNVGVTVSGRVYAGGLVGYSDHGSISHCGVGGAVSGGMYVGGLAGYLSGGTLRNCGGVRRVTAVVSGREQVGGLVGRSQEGTITDCATDGVTTGDNQVGGLVGWNEGGIVSDCSTTGSTTGRTQVGGLVGHHFWTTISNCCSGGPVTGGSHAGGLVGHSDYGSIAGCYATGTVSGTSQVGGLAGYFNWGYQGMIRDCYATGAVAGTSEVGGLAGSVSGGGGGGVTDMVRCCYATGAVTGASKPGGLIGYSSSYRSPVACFWDVEASGCATSAGGTGKTTAQMKDARTYQDAGWDFTSQDGDPPDWVMPANDYPIPAWVYVKQAARSTIPVVTGMDWQTAGGVIDAARFARGGVSWIPSEVVPPGDVVEQVPAAGSEGVEGFTGIDLVVSCGSQFNGGSGTADDPYQIKTIAEWMLLTVRPEHWDKHVALMADLDMLSLSVKPIGQSTQPFTGQLHGHGHVIRNALIRQPANSDAGLVGYLANGNIENLGVANAQVNGGEYSGALVGRNLGGAISCCFATGWVTGSSCVGGLVGGNLGGRITNCYAMSSVKTYDRGSAGGLVGFGQGTITNCYAAGQVDGPSSPYSGGLVGGASGRSAVTPDIHPVNPGSFWDTETSGQAKSCEGAGKTTAQMKDIQTYLNAGWDFTIEDGDRAEWVMPDGSYPRLAWEIAVRTAMPDATQMTVKDALGSIASVGFVIKSVSVVSSQVVPLGHVVSQLPAAGSEGMGEFTEVDLSVSCPDQFSGGSGIATDPYQIKSPFEWLLLSAKSEYWGKQFVLVADLDMLGLPLTPVGSASHPFTGSLGGSGHTIRNARISKLGDDYTGLIGYSTDGRIQNVGFENARVEGRDCVGGLVGRIAGKGMVIGCHADVTVVGHGSNAGGLAGSNQATISNCYASGTISGTSFVGGLVGLNGGTVSKSYAAAAVNGGSNVGGLVGDTSGYRGGGAGGPVSGSFWDTQASGPAARVDSLGRTTAQMRTANTFLDAGWDFVGEMANGTEDIWWIDEGKDYPRLWWELPPK